MADSKISDLTAATSLISTDEFVIASSGTTKKITAADMVSSFGSSTDGWTAAGETWTYASADSPTFTFTVAADVTTKYAVGMRVKLTQTTVKYFVVTKVSTFSGGNTTITIYGGTDYTLANASITSPYWSMIKAPFGFPMDPLKWTETLVNNATHLRQTSPSGAWQNLTSGSLPIGSWKVRFSGIIYFETTVQASYVVHTTLSTANNSESETAFTASLYGVVGTNGAMITFYRDRDVAVTSKTTLYVNIGNGSGATNVPGVGLYGPYNPTIVRAVCAYL